MATEFTVITEDRPGTLADLAEALSKGGVNLMAVHATPCPEHGIIQFVTDNPDATVSVLKAANINYTTRQVLLLTFKEEPGQLARLARALAQANININSVYITLHGQVVLDVSDLGSAQGVALALGIM
jgi:hypothetical protein